LTTHAVNRRQYLGLLPTIALSGCVSDGVRSDTEAGAQTAPSDDGPTTLEIPRGETVTHTFADTMKIRDYGWTDQELNYGTPGLTGTVENVGSQELAEARLAVEFYDENTQIGTNTSWLQFVAPAEYGTLEVPFLGNDPSRVTDIRVTGRVSLESLLQPNNGRVTVVKQTLTENQYDWPEVSGTVKNTSESQIERVLIHNNFYDGDRILGSSQDALDRLDADASGEWSNTTDRVTRDEVSRVKTTILLRT
jgi:hypothetical protein